MNKRNVGLVIKYEIVSMLRKPSFWFFTFVFPVMIMAFTFLPQVFAQRTITEASSALVAASRGPAMPYVDLAGIIQNIPEDMKAGFRAYPTEAEAKAALESGRNPPLLPDPRGLPRDGKGHRGLGASFAHGGPERLGPLEYVLRLNLAERYAGRGARHRRGPIAQMDERNLAPGRRSRADEEPTRAGASPTSSCHLR